MFVLIVASKSSDEMSRIEFVRLLATGVAHENVQTAETFDRACNEFLAEFLVPEVAWYGQGHASLGLNQVLLARPAPRSGNS